MACLLFAVLTTLPSIGMAAAAEEMPQLPATLNEQVLMQPVGTGPSSVELETTLFVPPGVGPFPLVVISHGRLSGDPRFDPRARYVVAAREFLQRGHLVAVPMRPGFSKSGGVHVAARCNIGSEARLQGETITAFLREMRRRADVDPDRILLVGEAEGGIAAIAAAATGFPGLRGVLNFAGGLRPSVAGCSWQEALVEAFAALGSISRVPSLWFYTDSDGYWDHEVARTMFQAYRDAGGQAELISHGTVAPGNPHAMLASPQAVPIWWPASEGFLRAIGLPTELRFGPGSTARPQRSGYADLTDSDALPHVDEHRRELYRRFLKMPWPRAFAIADTGNVGWAQGGADPLAAALDNCERAARSSCALYAVDDEVVWQGAERSRSAASDALREP